MQAAVTIYAENLDKPLEKKIIQTISDTLSTLGQQPIDFAVDVNFVDEKKMRKLNSDFRQKDYATDVLSFGQFEDVLKDKPKGIKVPIMLGDLVLCESVIKKEAIEEGKSYEEHLLMLVDHGMKHLLGIHHPED
ncbi:rRNA maturation RNase YbeY [Candidatus Curtissbacteria bacterium]|nr:rRNA maturation RNase YbeY [Candidatus Curtissbacteria bacterium]